MKLFWQFSVLVSSVFLFILFSVFSPFSSTVLATSLATSSDVEALLDQLSVLQNNNIEHTWPPDIEANEDLVQDMLLAYQELSTAEKEELTRAQNTELMAYFTTLYEIQGRDASELEAFLEEEVNSAADTSVSSHPITSSSSALSVSPAPAAEGTTNSLEPAPATITPSSAPPLSSSSLDRTNAMPDGNLTFSFLPSFFEQNPFAFFASFSFGQLLFVLCLVFLGFLLLRFFFSLASIGPPPGSKRQKWLDKKKQNKDENTSLQNDWQPDSPEIEHDIAKEPTITVKGAFNEKDIVAIDHLMKEEPLPLEKNTLSTEVLEDEDTLPIAEPTRIDTPLPSSNTSDEKSNNNSSIPRLGEARTGRPARMPFSQGDAFDLDAIDE